MSAVVVALFGLPTFAIAAIIGLLVLAAVAAVAFAVTSGEPTKSLKSQLNEYAKELASVPSGRPDSSLGDSAVMQQALDITERLGERYGLLEKVEHRLEQTDLPLRATEALFVYVAGIAVLFVLAALITQDLFSALLVGAAAGVLPVVFLDLRRRKRLKTFEEMLPDMLKLLAGTLRAGFSFMQGLEAVANETVDPMKRELQRAFTEAKLGGSIEESLNDVADRMDCQDLRWAVLAIGIQREVGGNLAELLDTVAETMTQRERLRAEIRALTAEGRFSAIILGLFPFALGVIMYVMSPGYIETLFQNVIGATILGISGIMTVAGFFWLKKTVTIEV